MKAQFARIVCTNTIVGGVAVGQLYPSYGDGFMSPVAFADDHTVMTETDFHRAASWMEAHGGGFMARLAQAYFHADGDNQKKLRNAFLGDFIYYHGLRINASRSEVQQ